jgi:hypothetical protein
MGGLLALSMMVGADTARADHCDIACRLAKRVCHRAVHLAYRDCRTACQEGMADALRTALQTCHDLQLDPTECRALVKAALSAAAGECHERCRSDLARAKAVCERAHQDCRNICALPVDEECVAACKDELLMCMDDLKLCFRDCRAAYKEAVAACFQGTGGVCPGPEAIRECVRAARREARACASGCYQTHTCRENFVECLRSCVIQDPSTP